MPVTAIKTDSDKLKFMTITMEPVLSDDGKTTKNFISIELMRCDDDFMPIGVGSKSIDARDEETYHKELRLAATIQGQYVPEESTDPQWNPGYEEPQEEISNGDTV